MVKTEQTLNDNGDEKMSGRKKETAHKRRRFGGGFLTILFFSVFAISAAPSVYAGNDYSLAGKGNIISLDKIGSVAKLENIEILMQAAGAEENSMSSALGGYGTMDAALAAGAKEGIDSISIWQVIYKYILSSWIAKELTHPYIPYAYKVKFFNPHTENEETGLLVAPWHFKVIGKGYWEKCPILAFQHPTQTLRKYSPSKCSWDDDQFTVHFAMIMAHMGFIVVVPDYPGMGDNQEVHPYCHEDLGKSTVAMIDAVKKIKHPDFKNGLKYKNETHLMGFSEGAYATLAAARYLQNAQNIYHLKSVAALDGPYDLSGTMRDLMMKLDTDSDEPYATPYFMPYTIQGYVSKYPAIKELDFKTAVVPTPQYKGKPFNVRLLDMLSGDYSGTDIAELMETVITYDKKPYNGPVTITSKRFQDALKNIDSDLNKKLLENTLFKSPWKPLSTVQYLFVHNRNDDSVPAGNTYALEKEWKKYPNVKFDYFTNTLPLSKDGVIAVGTIHGASILRAYMKGLKHIKEYK